MAVVEAVKVVKVRLVKEWVAPATRKLVRELPRNRINVHSVAGGSQK